LTELLIAAYGLTCATLLWATARRDVFFAGFTAMLVLYSVVSPVGYLLYPEISDAVLRMYFGPDSLAGPVGFSLLSMVALYAGFRCIYLPIVQAPAYTTCQLARGPGPVLLLLAAQAVVLLGGYAYFGVLLDYAVLSDVDAVGDAGVLLRLYWQLFKFTPFTVLALYALVRQSLFDGRLRLAAQGVLALQLVSFSLVAVTSGSRTDPLALALGLVAFEYVVRGARLSRMFIATALAGLVAAVALLTLLEAARGTFWASDLLDTPLLVQALLVKDYHVPFHVLIGAIHHDYVQPLAVLQSNLANALMFLNVDFLQAFVVQQWAPGTVTRAASPAMFAFTEGYVFAGWAGFLYNGVVLSLGLALWRRLSRGDHDGLNALAFAIVAAMAANVARSQSSYFIKDIYLFFLPALCVYCAATGIWPRRMAVFFGAGPAPARGS